MLHRRLLFIALTLLCLLAGRSAVSAMTPAGTVILTQARASFFDTATGSPENLISNQSWISVGALVRFVLEYDQKQTGTAGQQVFFIHRLSNRSNIADRYQLQLSLSEGTLENLAVYEYNGALPSQGTKPLTETRIIQPGESMEFVVMATIPTDSVTNDKATIILTAISKHDNTEQEHSQSIVTTGDVALWLSKTVNQARAAPGETLRYDISYQNTGNKPVPPGQTVVGGQPFSGVLLEDILPPQTTLDYTVKPEFAPVQAIAVLRTEDGQWHQLQNWDQAVTPTRIGLLIPGDQMVPGRGGYLGFAVRVNDNTKNNTLITNQARLYNQLDADTVENRRSLVDSNPAYTTVIADTGIDNPEPRLRFVEPAPLNDRLSFTGTFDLAGYYYLNDTESSRTKNDVYLELDGGNFNQSGEVMDVLTENTVTIRSGTGDSIRIKMQETGLDTGVFRSQSPLHLSVDKKGGNGLCRAINDSAPEEPVQWPDYSEPGASCYLQSTLDDTLSASITDPVTGTVFITTARVSPQGMVFSSETLAGLGGATVLFTSVETSDQVAVPVSDDSGRFYYPPLAPGEYFIDVQPPSNYQFPSKVPPAYLPGHKVSEASYGPNGYPEAEGLRTRRAVREMPGTFTVDTREQIEQFDIPVDPMANTTGTLSLTKEALQTEVAPGERVSYELTLINNTDADLYDVSVVDYLPVGFKYLSGTTRINDQPAADPEGAASGQLTFSAPIGLPLPEEADQGNPVVINYTLQARAGAIDSDGINRAQAFAKREGNGLAVTSNEAKARVEVKMDGVLSDKAILFGKVYLDSQCSTDEGNGVQGANDWPIGGVRLYMEDGTWVITDENGQYSLMGLNPGNHVIKVDPVTLPDGLVLKPLDNRNAADGNSRFVDLTNGEMHRADFAASCPANNYDAIFAQIKARNDSIRGDWLLDDAAQYNRSKPSETADSNGDLSNGVIRAPDAKELPVNNADILNPNSVHPERSRRMSGTMPESGVHALRQAQDERREADNKKLSTDNGPLTTESEKIPQAKEAIKTVTRQQAEKGTFLWPTNQAADGRFMAVVRAGVEPSLYINGEVVAKDRLGEQLLNNREQAQLMAWYGVSLNEGDNRVEIKAKDMFGNERILASGTFQYAGAAVSLKIIPAAETLAADGGRSLLPVTIKLQDSHGLPARGIYFVTLETTAGGWQEQDIQDREPGHQIRIDNGEALVNLRSGHESGPVTLRASTGELSADTGIHQVAAARPLMAVGLVEINSGKMPDLLSATGSDSDTRSRMATFIKGDIAKDTQLTLSYDSDKDDDAELFRDVDPDDYYPITGDASQKGYEAQSRSKLYAKVEKGLSSIMWGDYQSDSQSSEYDLAKVQRNLNGLNGIYDNGKTRVQGFAARPENTISTEIIEPNGTAMNYRLEGAPIVRHSETVVLEVWSRDNPGLMLSSTTLSRGSDYTLDEFSGYLKFSEPVNSRDEEGNPQKIRVTYELEGDGEAYTVAGARIEQQLNEQVVVGASYTRDEHETEGSEISGAWVEYKPSEKTTIALSAATMTGKTPEDEGGALVKEEKGSATRLKIKQQWSSSSETEVTWAKADQHFTNSSGGVSSGREETRIQHKQQLNNTLNLRAEAEVSRSLDEDSGGSSQGNSAGVYLDKKVGDGWQLTAGSRYIQQGGSSSDESDESDEQSDYMTAQVGVEKRFKLLEKEASISTEYERALTNGRWRAALESDWKVHDKVSIYGRFERDNNLSPISGGTDQNEFSFGVKSDWLANTQTYSEYRMRGATEGDHLEWVNGADTSLELSEGLSVTPSVEWINTIRGDSSNDGLALSLGFADKRQSNQRANGRIEYRYGQQQDYYGLDGAIARRLNTDWAGLVREQFNLELPKDDEGKKRMEHAFTLGLAHRPKRDNSHHGLYLYQWKEERDDEEGAENRTVHLISTHQNRQIRRGLILSGRIGTKWMTEDLQGNPFDSQTTVFDSRLTWDLNHRWDLDLRSGLLSVDGDNSVQWSAGVGLNYLVVENLRVGVHYNIEGFTDEDLDSEKYNAEGVHFSLMFKFDESVFDWFDA